MIEIIIKNVDVKLLNEQRLALVKLIHDKVEWNDHVLWGLVEMLDDVCDEHIDEIEDTMILDSIKEFEGIGTSEISKKTGLELDVVFKRLTKLALDNKIKFKNTGYAIIGVV